MEHYIEITLNGYNGATDETDNLILWVKGNSQGVMKAVSKVRNSIKAIEKLSKGFEDDSSIDFSLPEETNQFINRVKELTNS